MENEFIPISNEDIEKALKCLSGRLINLESKLYTFLNPQAILGEVIIDLKHLLKRVTATSKMIEAYKIKIHKIKRKGLPVDVLRPAHDFDSTSGGISSKHGAFILVGDGVPEIVEPTENIPAIKLVRKKTPVGELMYAEPMGGKLYLHGGNYLRSTDKRFEFQIPIPIHDWEHDAG